MIRTGLFAMVRHEDVPARLASGWMIEADLGPTHGFYPVLMWRCDCGVAR